MNTVTTKINNPVKCEDNSISPHMYIIYFWIFRLDLIMSFGGLKDFR